MCQVLNVPYFSKSKFYFVFKSSFISVVMVLILDKNSSFSLLDNNFSSTKKFRISVAIKAHLANPAKGNVPYFLQSSITNKFYQYNIMKIFEYYFRLFLLILKLTGYNLTAFDNLLLIFISLRLFIKYFLFIFC